MTQPTRYVRQYHATGWAVAHPGVPQPGTAIDAEFNALKVSLDETHDNLALIQRDDGELANVTVGLDQLKSEVTIHVLKTEVSELAAVATSGSASDLSAGTVPDARMPAWAGYTAETKAAAEGATIVASVDLLRTTGYTTVGDGGGALYKRVAAEPAHAGKIQSADGSWWEIVCDAINVRQFGAVGDGAASDSTAINNAITYWRTFGTAEAGWETTRKGLLFPPGRYLIGTSLNFQSLRSFGTHVVAWGAVLLGECLDRAVVDALDTRFLVWEGGTIIGSSDALKMPRAGFAHGRRASDNRVADTITIKGLIATGRYSGSSYVNFQAETVRLRACMFSNKHSGFSSTTCWLDSLNDIALTSDYSAAPSATPISANMFHAVGCEFKTFDSDGVSRGAGYPVRISTNYTDGAAWRDIVFDEYYANAISLPNAVQHTDHNVSIFFVKGYVHNLVIKGRGERFGYIDAILRVANDTDLARIKGLTMREHYLGVKAGMIQSNGGANAIIITQGNLSATRSQEMSLASPAAAPAGTLFGNANDGSSSLIAFSGVVMVPNDVSDSYRLNDFSGVTTFNGAIYTQAAQPNIVYPSAGQFTISNNTRVENRGAHVFDGQMIVRNPVGLFAATRANLPVPSTIGEGISMVTNPETGKSGLVYSDASNWRYASDASVVTSAPSG